MFTDNEMKKLETKFDFSYMKEWQMLELNRAKKDWEIRDLRGEKQNDIYTKISGSYGVAIADFTKDCMSFLKTN